MYTFLQKQSSLVCVIMFFGLILHVNCTNNTSETSIHYKLNDKRTYFVFHNYNNSSDQKSKLFKNKNSTSWKFDLPALKRKTRQGEVIIIFYIF